MTHSLLLTMNPAKDHSQASGRGPAILVGQGILADLIVFISPFAIDGRDFSWRLDFPPVAPSEPVQLVYPFTQGRMCLAKYTPQHRELLSEQLGYHGNWEQAGQAGSKARWLASRILGIGTTQTRPATAGSRVTPMTMAPSATATSPTAGNSLNAWFVVFYDGYVNDSDKHNGSTFAWCAADSDFVRAIEDRRAGKPWRIPPPIINDHRQKEYSPRRTRRSSRHWNLLFTFVPFGASG